jgi:protein-disulfide isomerase
MNDAERSIVMRRPDVRFVRRHYPLDSTCNPDMQRQVHAGACELARGAICAERLGRFEAYDDLVFASQGSKVDPEVTAMQAGLDVAAFRDCLSSPETDERLAADIQAARQARIQGTPSLEVRGKVYSLDELYPLLGLDPRRP